MGFSQLGALGLLLAPSENSSAFKLGNSSWRLSICFVALEWSGIHVSVTLSKSSTLRHVFNSGRVPCQRSGLLV